MSEENIKIFFDKVSDVVSGRRQEYGPITDEFKRIAEATNSIIGEDKFTPGDIGLVMVMMKMVRQKDHPKEDNLIDACGYISGINELLT